MEVGVVERGRFVLVDIPRSPAERLVVGLHRRMNVFHHDSDLRDRHRFRHLSHGFALLWLRRVRANSGSGGIFAVADVRCQVISTREMLSYEPSFGGRSVEPGIGLVSPPMSGAGVFLSSRWEMGWDEGGSSRPTIAPGHGGRGRAG